MNLLPEPTGHEGPHSHINRGETGLTEKAKANEKITSLSEAMELALERVREDEFSPIEDPDPDPYGYAQEFEHEFGVNILAPKWKASPDDDKWVKRIKSRARKTAVARMYLEGYTTAQIAMKCKVSEVTIHRDIVAITNEWRESYLDDIEVLASRDLARLDEMLLRLAKQIEKGSINAIKAGVDIIRERGNILGYRHGVQVDIEQHIRETAEAAGFDPDTAVSIAQRVRVRYET